MGLSAIKALDENIHSVIDTIERALERLEVGHQSPPSVASRMTTALRSGDFKSPVFVWSLPADGREPE